MLSSDYAFQETPARYRAVEPSSGSSVIPRRACPGLAGLRPQIPTQNTTREGGGLTVGFFSRKHSKSQQFVISLPGYPGTYAPRCVLSRLSPTHPEANPGANLESISHRCYLREEAFGCELTQETINLPLGHLQGSLARRCSDAWLRFVSGHATYAWAIRVCSSGCAHTQTRSYL